MTELIKKLKSEVIKAASNPEFMHYKWYVKWHLEIVENLALELCDSYPSINKDMVLILVWLHDYGKIIDRSNEYEATITHGKPLLEGIGFEKEFINQVIEYINIFESKMENDLSNAPLEVQIVSSADAASHMIGP